MVIIFYCATVGYNYASRDAQYKIGKKNLDNSTYNWAISSFLINAAKNELIIDHIFKHMIISTNFLGMQID